MGGSLFSSQRCASLGKLKFCQNHVFHKTWVQKGSLLMKKITSDWKTFSLVNIYGTLVLPQKPNLSSNYHSRKPFFRTKMCLFGKIKNFHNRVFHKTWVQNGSLLTQKITSDWKTFSSGSIYGTLASPYMSYLSSNPHGRKPFFKTKMCLFGKIEILSKSCFS